jgi:ribonuclease D
VAAKRLARVRAALGRLATDLGMPVENLLQPEAARRLAWTPPVPLTVASVVAELRRHGARDWQVTAVSEDLAVALPDPPPVAVAVGEPEPEPEVDGVDGPVAAPPTVLPEAVQRNAAGVATIMFSGEVEQPPGA